MSVFMNLKNWRSIETGNVLSITSCSLFNAILQDKHDYPITRLNPHKFRYKLCVH